MSKVRIPLRLKREVLVAKVKTEIAERVKEIPHLQNFKHSEELAELAGCVAKTLLPERKLKKYDVKLEDVVFEVLTTMYQYDEQEQSDLRSRIVYLNQKGLIKVAPFLKSTAKLVCNWLFKKLL